MKDLQEAGLKREARRRQGLLRSIEFIKSGLGTFSQFTGTKPRLRIDPRILPLFSRVQLISNNRQFPSVYPQVTRAARKCISLSRSSPGLDWLPTRFL